MEEIVVNGQKLGYNLEGSEAMQAFEERQESEMFARLYPGLYQFLIDVKKYKENGNGKRLRH